MASEPQVLINDLVEDVDCPNLFRVAGLLNPWLH